MFFILVSESLFPQSSGQTGIVWDFILNSMQLLILIFCTVQKPECLHSLKTLKVATMCACESEWHVPQVKMLFINRDSITHFK